MLREKAKELAETFLAEESEYRMAYIDAEKPHPMTRDLSGVFTRSVEDGIRLLLSVDLEMAKRAAETLLSHDFSAFADKVCRTILSGHRVIFSGCGSSGRLSMRLERSWREAMEKLIRSFPEEKTFFEQKLHSVGNIMTGGDYAVIRAVESFEDSTRLGMAQAAELRLGEGDLLVGVTATGETTSILGTAARALQDGAEVTMLICSDHRPLLEKMARAREVYLHPRCSVLSLPCGPMALTGSTRMQSSTFEQLVGGAALEGALAALCKERGLAQTGFSYAGIGTAFVDTVNTLLSGESIAVLSGALSLEQEVYEKGGLMTYFADGYLLDVLTDTTERAPTFMTPPFCSADMEGKEQSWAFVKNPVCSTEEAWFRCFAREPHCIAWSADFYRSLGLSEESLRKIPDITQRGLLRYRIGNEPMPERESAAPSCALWVDAASAPNAFSEIARAYTLTHQLTLAQLGLKPMPTAMDLMEHLSMKLILNTISTGVMARMGRITGNWMTNLDMSNKKLVDRSARIVSDVCGVPYEVALEEIYYAKLLSESKNARFSPARNAIERIQKGQ